jgi:hypothetical protein
LRMSLIGRDRYPHLVLSLDRFDHHQPPYLTQHCAFDLQSFTVAPSVNLDPVT